MVLPFLLFLLNVIGHMLLAQATQRSQMLVYPTDCAHRNTFGNSCSLCTKPGVDQVFHSLARADNAKSVDDAAYRVTDYYITPKPVDAL